MAAPPVLRFPFDDKKHLPITQFFKIVEVKSNYNIVDEYRYCVLGVRRNETQPLKKQWLFVKRHLVMKALGDPITVGGPPS